jgi:hypothetical protein
MRSFTPIEETNNKLLYFYNNLVPFFSLVGVISYSSIKTNISSIFYRKPIKFDTTPETADIINKHKMIKKSTIQSIKDNTFIKPSQISITT